MSDTSTNPQPTTADQPEVRKPISSHTYQDDLSRAMDATDATVVQKMLEEARERESNMKDEVLRKKQKGWYTLGTIFLLILATGAIAYGIYHYSRLTVPVKKSFSVGVFPQTKTFFTENTDIRKIVTDLSSDQTLEEGKPTLVNLVHNETTKTPLSKQELFSFFEAKATEPFLAAFDVFRFGIMNTGTKIVPFIIGGVADSEITSKELLIVEPDLLQIFYKPLNIPIAKYNKDIGGVFTQQYVYNLPTRGLSLADENGDQKLVLFYGYATEKIVVFSTDYSVLKSIYDSILSQQ